jgi:Asp-tRNA(Asn)/Glu-tRNA(Gln) amidotransferase A subunit family amidase
LSRSGRDYLPTVTPEQQAEAVRLMAVFGAWFYEHVMPHSEEGYCSTVLILPWTRGRPIYRERFGDKPLELIGTGLPLQNIAPFAEAPELIIPVGTTPYQSKFTGRTEQLPAAIGLVGAKGSDMMLVELVNAMVVAESSSAGAEGIQIPS